MSTGRNAEEEVGGSRCSDEGGLPGAYTQALDVPRVLGREAVGAGHRSNGFRVSNPTTTVWALFEFVPKIGGNAIRTHLRCKKKTK